MSQLAEVALPIGVEKTFTYLIPTDLQSSAVIGVRVLVPFGRKRVTGLIVDLTTESSLKTLRSLSDIIDSQPVVSQELLTICKWIAEYYFAPLGEVLKAALPHGFASSKRVVRTALSGEDLTCQMDVLRVHHPQRAALLQLLSSQSSIQASNLRKLVGLKSINSILNEMEKQGLLTTEEILPHSRQKPKLRDYVDFDSIDAALIAGALRGLTSRKVKTRQLLHSLQQLKDQGTKDIAVTELLKTSGASSASLKGLAASGLVRIFKREVNRTQEYGIETQTLRIILNEDQKRVLQDLTHAIESGTTKPFLLHGVTGSGKTQVYIEAIRYCLDRDRTAIVLVPEISLTPQMVRRFKSHFGDQVAVVHSRMSTGERYDVWRLALRGVYRIVIGPRSAIFAPVRNLGLVVVDEEHEASYKQYDAAPRYNARDVAIVRAVHNTAVVVLGSATPSAESYYNALNGKYTLLEMSHRVDQVPMPEIKIVNMADERKKAYATLKESLPKEQRRKLKDFRQSSISELLREEIGRRLSRNEGVILLQNRRGFAPFVECRDCGFAETCEKCSITLTYHLAKKHLRCHYCGLVRSPRMQCPNCRGTSIELSGIGTQRVEQELETLFPAARVLRMDLDTTTRKGSHDRILRKFGEGEADILLGTQMVAKGLDFPRVTLVGVISADTQLLLPDFRSSERTFQLLTQVAGRAGRSSLIGEVIIQTHQPQHFVIQHVVDHNVKEFYDQEMEERRELDYPPFSRIALVEMKGMNEAEVRTRSERFARLLKEVGGEFVVLGPSPAVIARINNQYRWHVIMKSSKAKDPAGTMLRSALRKTLAMNEEGARRSVKMIVDIDPVGMM